VHVESAPAADAGPCHGAFQRADGCGTRAAAGVWSPVQGSAAAGFDAGLCRRLLAFGSAVSAGAGAAVLRQEDQAGPGGDGALKPLTTTIRRSRARRPRRTAAD